MSLPFFLTHRSRWLLFSTGFLLCRDLITSDSHDVWTSSTLQVGLATPYCIFGESILPIFPYLFSYHDIYCAARKTKTVDYLTLVVPPAIQCGHTLGNPTLPVGVLNLVLTKINALLQILQYLLVHSKPARSGFLLVQMLLSKWCLSLTAVGGSMSHTKIRNFHIIIAQSWKIDFSCCKGLAETWKLQTVCW